MFLPTRGESNNGDILPLYSLPPLAHIHCYQSHIILHDYIIIFPRIDVVSLATQFVTFDPLIYIWHFMGLGWEEVRICCSRQSLNASHWSNTSKWSTCFCCNRRGRGGRVQNNDKADFALKLHQVAVPSFPIGSHQWMHGRDWKGMGWQSLLSSCNSHNSLVTKV